VLCWLALLLIRIIETRTGQTWHHVRRHLGRLHAVTFTGPTGTFRQRTDRTKPQIDLYARLDLPLPKKIMKSRPQSADQPQPCRIVTHAPRVPPAIPAGQNHNPSTRSSPQLRDAGDGPSLKLT
jgi:hypothetical protein